jgi:ankyrin repeat protein
MNESIDNSMNPPRPSVDDEPSCLIRAISNHDQSVRHILNLIEQFPQQVLLRDTDHNAPLHYTCQRRDIDLVILKLLEIHPDASSYSNTEDEYPLHIACRCGASIVVVSKLLEHFATVIKKQDNDGDLPLHNACRGCENVILTLI